MKLNRKWILVMSLVLSLVIATGSTLAYLIDTTETKTNVFTLGNVEITLTEDMWVDKSALLPGKPVNKNPTITNDGWHDAWVWMDVVIPAALYEKLTLDGVSDDWIKAETTNTAGNKVVTLKYKETLASGNSVTAFDTVTLSADAKYADLKALGSEVKIDITAYAIEAAQFDNIDAAIEAYNGEKNIPADAKPVATFEALKEAVAEGGNIVLDTDIEVTEMIEIPGNVSIYGRGYTLTRDDSYTGTILSLSEYAELALSNITLDGENVESTGNLIYIDSFGKLTLNDGTVLENHVGGTTYDSTRGPENSVIHCDGETTIVMNEGSIIRNNVAKGGFATVIASMYNLTCELNGGQIINNTSEKNNYTVNFGNYANITVSDGFEMSGNTDGGLIRLNQQTNFTMNGGKLDGNGKSAIYTWVTQYVTLNGGEIIGNVSLNYTPATVGGTDVDGVIYKDNEVTKWAMNLTPDFGTVRYSIAGNLTQLNIVPAEGYTYVAGDENKLICENADYETYWDAESGCFKVKASN